MSSKTRLGESYTCECGCVSHPDGTVDQSSCKYVGVKTGTILAVRVPSIDPNKNEDTEMWVIDFDTQEEE